MTKKYLQIFLTLITIFAINAVKSDDTVEALQKILKELNAQLEERYDDGNHISKIIHHPRHFKHGKPKHSRGSPNLMNIQTMNLFLKPNKRQREEPDAKRFPHTAARADMCKTVGRCGCSGARCGTKREDDLADEVDRVLNEVNKGLARDDDDLHKFGDGVHVDDERDERNRDEIRKNDIKDDLNRDRDEGDLQRDRDDKDVTKKEDKYDDYYEIKYVKDDKYDDRGKSTVDRKNRVYINDFLNSKKFKVNNNLDVVILDKSDLDVLLRNEDIVDLSRKDVDKGEKDIHERVRKEFKKIIAAEDKTGYKSSDVITVQDLFFHFENVRQQAVAQVLKYLQNKINLINLKFVSPEQKKLLRSLKMKYIHGQLQDDDLGEEIENIIFGKHSNMKIVAQTENSNSIYIPQWIYDKVITSKKKLNEPVLRDNPIQKRILPLTKQQKERLTNIEKGKFNPKTLIWRKNAGQDIRRLGIPFDFEIHGLGQVAP